MQCLKKWKRPLKLIELSQGLFASVDDEDFEELNRHKWCAIRTPTGRYYAVRNGSRMGNGGRQKSVRMHCVTMGISGVDHRDNDGLNNQRSNLRPASHKQNIANTGSRGGTSRYRGVSFAKAQKSKPWFAQILVDKKNKNLGYYASEIEAAKAYDIAALAYQGEYAYLNFPPEKEQV